MQRVKITEFRANLSKYLNKAHDGEFVTITSSGKILAMLVALVEQHQKAINWSR
ncbi:MAG: type II toxin-antitoxin system Phd/YefM family antitoxin [Thermosynechococcaceae cyanobacterium]